MSARRRMRGAERLARQMELRESVELATFVSTVENTLDEMPRPLYELRELVEDNDEARGMRVALVGNGCAIRKIYRAAERFGNRLTVFQFEVNLIFSKLNNVAHSTWIKTVFQAPFA